VLREAARQCAVSALLFGCAGVLEKAPGQVTLTIDPHYSLVWWQIEPHYGHLWGTSCPGDPSWRAGEGHSPGYYMSMRSRPRGSGTEKADARVPMYPRLKARPLCRQAVRGRFQAANAREYSNLKGDIAVIADSIVSGLDSRDAFSRRFVFRTAVHPMLTFRIDSLSRVVHRADKVHAVVHGVFEFRGSKRTIAVPIQGAPEAGGLRIQGKYMMPAQDLRDVYDMSEVITGAGLGLRMWESVHFGFDLVVRSDQR